MPRVALAGDLLPNLRFVGDDPAALRKKFRAAKDRTGRRMLRPPGRDRCIPTRRMIEALRLFCRRHTTLAVVERETKKLVGIVSYWDAIAAIARED